MVRAVLDDQGRLICCEMWPGNTADVKTLVPLVERLCKRFHIARFCIVTDRGMISADTMQMLERPDCNIPYIPRARMRLVKDVSKQVLCRPGRYRQVRPQGCKAKDPSPLAVKEVWVDDRRYIVCKNSRQARKDAATRQAIIEALEQRVRSEPKKLIGNRGYASYLNMVRGAVTIDRDKIDAESRFDGKWVLRTNMNLCAEHTALRYKELWTVERVFRDVKTILETRPVFHKRDATIPDHVFCSFLALVMRKELGIRLEQAGHTFECNDIKRDLSALQEITIQDNGRKLTVRTACTSTCGKIFQAVRVRIPPTIREV